MRPKVRRQDLAKAPTLVPEDDRHWSAEELASFAANPGVGRVLNIRTGAPSKTAMEDCLREAGYCLGRLSITRDPSHLPQAAATFTPDLMYLSLSQPFDACLAALEVLATDRKTNRFPLVALVPEHVAPSVIEEAYTRSGCDFFRVGSTKIELLARTHLLVRLSKVIRGATTPAPITGPALPKAANAPMGDKLDLRDPQTGLYTAIYFRHRLPIETARAHRYQRDLSILAVRCQNAAEHESAALQIARTLTLSCRDVDLIGRLEPDLFIVLLPETPTGGGATVLDRIAGAMREANLDHAIGRAALGDDADDAHSAEQLLHLACRRADPGAQ